MTIWKTKLKDIGSDEFGNEVSEGIGSWSLGKTGCLVVVAIVLLVITSAIGKFALGWFDAATKVVSPENVTQQFHDAYTRFESLQAEACTVKSAQALVDAQPDPAVKVQLQSQEQAYEQNYRRIAAEYQAAFDNAFEAKHVGPNDLPGIAPSLEADMARCP